MRNDDQSDCLVMICWREMTERKETSKSTTLFFSTNLKLTTASVLCDNKCIIFAFVGPRLFESLMRKNYTRSHRYQIGIRQTAKFSYITMLQDLLDFEVSFNGE